MDNSEIIVAMYHYRYELPLRKPVLRGRAYEFKFIRECNKQKAEQEESLFEIKALRNPNLLKPFEPGDKVRLNWSYRIGTVVSVSQDSVLVDFGYHDMEDQPCDPMTLRYVEIEAQS